MWLFTTLGFFSVTVAQRSRKDARLDQRRIQVRARSKRHLQNLKKRFPYHVRGKTVRYKDSDYPYRVYVDRHDWKEVVKALVQDIDYGNFKNAVKEDSRTEPEYLQALHLVWDDMFREFQQKLSQKAFAPLYFTDDT